LFTHHTKEQIYAEALSLIKIKNFFDASKKIEKLLSQDPYNLDLLNTLAVCWIQLGKNEKAYDVLYKSIKANNFNETILLTFGNLLFDTGEYDKAQNIYSEGKRIFPENIEFVYGLALVEEKNQNFKKAIEAYTYLINKNPHEYRFYMNRSGLAIKQGDYLKALSDCEKAIELNPDFAELYYNKAIVELELNNIPNAEVDFRKAIQHNRKYAGAYYNLALISPENHLNIFDGITENDVNTLQDNDKVLMFFALSRISECSNDYGESWKYLCQANALKKSLIDYTIEKDILHFEQIKTCSTEFTSVVKNLKHSESEPTPIFIIGMPRSGTSIVEQIISSHSEVLAGGEKPFINEKGQEIFSEIGEINLKNLNHVKNTYLDEITKNHPKYGYETDKHPLNFKYIDLIYGLFPKAKIVHVFRDPYATCFSNFRHFFQNFKNLEFTFDLEDIVSFYNLYSNLMSYWECHYSDKIFHLDYEKLTSNPNKVIPDLIEFLGLEFEQACLYPEKNKNIMRTASRHQVTKPIYKNSSEKWKKYQSFCYEKMTKIKGLN